MSLISSEQARAAWNRVKALEGEEIDDLLGDLKHRHPALSAFKVASLSSLEDEPASLGSFLMMVAYEAFRARGSIKQIRLKEVERCHHVCALLLDGLQGPRAEPPPGLIPEPALMECFLGVMNAEAGSQTVVDLDDDERLHLIRVLLTWTKVLHQAGRGEPPRMIRRQKSRSSR